MCIRDSAEVGHGLVLSGGSAFGLDAAGGVMAWLEERNIGFDVGVTKVPLVAQAILFDLALGDFRARPDKEMAYRACCSAVCYTHLDVYKRQADAPPRNGWR